MSSKLVAYASVWSLLWAFGASVASAREPEAVFWRVIEAAREGAFHPGLTPGGDTQVLVELFPSDEQFRQQQLLVVFPGCGEDPSSANRPVLNLEDVLRRGAPARYPSEWEDPGPRWRVCPAESAFLLAGGEAQQLSLSVDFLRAVAEGVSPRLVGEVHVLSEDDLAKIDPQKDVGCQWASIVGRRAPAAQLTIDLYYRLSDRDSFLFGEYADVFGKPGPNPVADARMTGDYRQGAGDLQVDLLSFHSDRLIPAQTHDDGGRLFRKTLQDARRKGTALVGSSVCSSEDFQVGGRHHRRGEGDDDDHCEDDAGGCHEDGLIGVRPDLLPQSAAPVTNFATYHVSGRFSTKWSADHSLHPGFGFRAEAWTDDFLGIWVRLASDWVQSDGTWSLTLPPSFLFNGHRLRMLYVTSTDYYDAQDINGNHYAWRDPDWLDIPTTFDVGHRFADTDGGTFNGVGEMVDAAMYTWSRLYWNGGLNPVRSSPINLIAPNTGLACGGTSPWSCANGGSIWLIAAHAAQAQVVSHELGHQLNFKFWNDKRPANNGGSHSLSGCYSTRLGMTLFEGFADFLAGWVGYPGRNVADGGFGSGRWALGWDLEPRTTPPSCTNGWENETWVARTFWDLHDTHGDGNDVLWFNSLGAVPALYLANGVANDGDARDMRDYRTVYRNAASPGHQTYISDIFDQNKQ